MSEQKKINIRNKRATFDYEILEEYVAGVVLVGTEIKSIRAGKASMVDTFCYFDNPVRWRTRLQPRGLRLRAADVSRRSCRRGNRARLIRRGAYGCCLPNNRRRHYRLFRSDSE